MIERCEWRWLGAGLGWGQITYCHAEDSCATPPVPTPPPPFNEAAYTLCTSEGGDG